MFTLLAWSEIEPRIPLTVFVGLPYIHDQLSLAQRLLETAYSIEVEIFAWSAKQLLLAGML